MNPVPGPSSAVPNDPSNNNPITLVQMNNMMVQMLDELARQQQEVIQKQVQAAVHSAVVQLQQQLPAASTSSSSSSSGSGSSSDPTNPIYVAPIPVAALPSKVKVATPGTFTGNRTLNVDTWLFEMNQYLAVCGVTTDNQRIAVASSYLKEVALQWWLGRCRHPNIPPQDWPSFVNALKERFQPLAASRTARAELHNLRQGAMSVADYSNKFYSLIQLITDMGEADQVERFIYGLRHAISKEVDMREPKTLQDAMSAAQKIELLLDNRRHYLNRPYPTSNYSSSYRPSPQYTTSSSTPSTSATASSAPMELGNLNAPVDDGTNGQEPSEHEEETADLEAEYQRYLEEGVDNYEPAFESENVDGGDGGAESEMLQAMQQRGGRAPFLSREEFSRCMKERLCLRCKKPGHVARFCPLRPRQQQQTTKRNFQ